MDTMKALVWSGGSELLLMDRPLPTLQDSRDAIVRVTRSTLCTSDLHIRAGLVPRAVPGVVLGHEFTGVVVKVGGAVTGLHPGDRVAACCETFCGTCWFCKRGYVNNCTRGGWLLGCRIDGCQAEYVRVPFADTGLTPIPDTLSDEDALFVGDILSTGYFGAELCEIRPGDSVLVLGAGPVGLCAAQCARLFGAGKVLIIEPDPLRRAVAMREELADLALDPADPTLEAQIHWMTHGRGADAVIEAAGTSRSFATAWQLARPNAIVALVAMYGESQTLPLPTMYGKNLIFKTGGVDARHCATLMQLLADRRLRTGFLITHRGDLEHILEGYQIFAGREDGCLKWVAAAQNC